MHVIAAKATAFKLAGEPEFKDRQERTLRGASILADAALTADDSKAGGVDVLTGGTDVHLVLADLRNSAINGQQAEDALHEVGITVNRNAVPFDPRPPMVTTGLRIGTPALATRGFGDGEFTEVADVIAEALKPERRHPGPARPRQGAHRGVPALPGWPRSVSRRGPGGCARGSCLPEFDGDSGRNGSAASVTRDRATISVEFVERQNGSA